MWIKNSVRSWVVLLAKANHIHYIAQPQQY